MRAKPCKVFLPRVARRPFAKKCFCSWVDFFQYTNPFIMKIAIYAPGLGSADGKLTLNRPAPFSMPTSREPLHGILTAEELKLIPEYNQDVKVIVKRYKQIEKEIANEYQKGSPEYDEAIKEVRSEKRKEKKDIR